MAGNPALPFAIRNPQLSLAWNARRWGKLFISATSSCAKPQLAVALTSLRADPPTPRADPPRSFLQSPQPTILCAASLQFIMQYAQTLQRSQCSLPPHPSSSLYRSYPFSQRCKVLCNRIQPFILTQFGARSILSLAFRHLQPFRR